MVLMLVLVLLLVLVVLVVLDQHCCCWFWCYFGPFCVDADKGLVKAKVLRNALHRFPDKPEVGGSLPWPPVEGPQESPPGLAGDAGEQEGLGGAS